MKMTEGIRVVAAETGFTQGMVNEVVRAFFEASKRALAKGDVMDVPGFGVFMVRVRKPRNGRNPRTGETLHIGETHHVFFKPSKPLKELVKA